MRFEQAVEAIVEGKIRQLAQLLEDDPGLVVARSTNEHRSTLLHYVSANGVEDQRQTTPPNIVGVATLLLDAGSDVNAESNAYGGGSTTLMLAATSVHPEKAGVQLALMQLLIDRGATLDANIVRACLHNGRGQAAKFLADRGAPLDFEGAAGTGRLQMAQSFFPAVTETQLVDGFCWACAYGHTAVVEFLLNEQPALATSRRINGQTGLHWASHSGHEKIATLLLQHGADPNARETVWDGTPADWADHARRNPPNR